MTYHDPLSQFTMSKPPDLLPFPPFPPFPSLVFALSASSLTPLAGVPLCARLKAEYDYARYGVWPASVLALPLSPSRSALSCALCGWLSRSSRSPCWVQALVTSLQVWPITNLHCCDCSVFRYVPIDGMLWSLPHHCLPLSGKSLIFAAQGCARYCARYGNLLVSVVFVRSSATCGFFTYFYDFPCSDFGSPLLYCVYLLLLDFGLWCHSSLSPRCEFSAVSPMDSPNQLPLLSSDDFNNSSSPTLPPKSDPPPLAQNSTPLPPLPASSLHGFSSFSDALRRGVVSHSPGDDVPPPRSVVGPANPDINQRAEPRPSPSVVGSGPSDPLPQATESTPPLDDLLALCLLAKIWGEPIPLPLIISKTKLDWKYVKGMVEYIELGNGWILLKFSTVADKDYVWVNRPWFVKGLNFVLTTWVPFFDPYSATIQHIDQWVRISLLPWEFWEELTLALCFNLLGMLFVLTRILCFVKRVGLLGSVFIWMSLNLCPVL